MMKAVKLLDSKHAFDDGAIQQLVIWELPEPVLGSQHRYKYRLYYGKGGERIVGYDNERGKGDHKHIRGEQYAYTFTGIDDLVRDFLQDLKEARQ
ncbi:MAG TPA: DUF6516 family protein [Candidatus Thiothrix moscowensis]|uniref:toxin-antitoxin system TumE family protein n=1 Tax=unclassified Thiothrix TaxID=2636184 RepID=UPI0025D822F7|nr:MULTISPECIES: DUF6516 family protein [unclassified Thiothrix]HRJ51274.1 DUF6516 family protein [Candidatus Thiothrix moscowensis]HRJ91671.1 DUF6516 family protein [Candidatus Thiothrix moscowensis]